jgi:hypothetical protein
MLNKDSFQFEELNSKITPGWVTYEDYSIVTGEEIIEAINKGPFQNRYNENPEFHNKQLDEINPFQNKEEKFICFMPGLINNYDYKTYAPMKKKDLFLKFASLYNKSDKEIIKFVNKYGLLDSNSYYNVLIPYTKNRFQMWYPYNKFKKEIKIAYELLLIYEELKKPKIDFNNLRKLLKTIKITDLEYHFLYMQNRYYEDVKKKRPTNEEILKIYLRHIEFTIQEKVTNHIAPSFGKINYDPDNYNKHWNIDNLWNYDNLLAAMYMQFYLVIIENKTIGWCNYCGQPFVKEKSDKEYCEGCRQNAYNHRKTKAIRLYKEGSTIKEIYLKLDKRSKKSTIKGWVNAD